MIPANQTASAVTSALKCHRERSHGGRTPAGCLGVGEAGH